jgi:hypothetical protein
MHRASHQLPSALKPLFDQYCVPAKTSAAQAAVESDSYLRARLRQPGFDQRLRLHLLGTRRSRRKLLETKGTWRIVYRGNYLASWSFKEAVRGVPIKRQRDRDQHLVAVDALSVSSLHSRRLHGHSLSFRSFRRLLIMRTFKEQAAQARAAGLKRFIADRPCRHGHLERRADDKGTCIACNYLRFRPLVRSVSTGTITAAE